MFMKHLFFLFSIVPLISFAQVDDCEEPMFVSGKIISESGRPIFDAMVVNRTRSYGQFCESDGSYLIKLCKSDTIQFAATGYTSVRLTYADSAYRFQKTFNVVMRKLRVSIPEVEVFAPRDLQAISDDIQRLGFNESDYRSTGVNALQSPITFLYEAFSRRERGKRESYELRNNDRRRDLLKELFAKYVEYDIITLEDDEFDAFIDYMDPGDERLKAWSQYEFILYVKNRFASYKQLPRKISNSDYEYHLDD